MFIYWGIFLILSTGALLNQEESGRRSRLMFVLFASIPTILMIGFRWKIGPDWDAYVDIFKHTRFYSLGEAIIHQDPGFYVLNWLVNLLDAPFWLLNMICGAIFVSGLTAFCRRQPNPWLAFLVAFPYVVVVVAMSGDRQSVALGFLFFGLIAFEEERLLRFVVLIMAAALFHGSILLILPLCFFSYTRNGLQRTLLLIVAALLGYYYFQDVFSDYARRYSSDRLQSSGVIYRLAMNAMSALAFLIMPTRFGLNEHEMKLWRNISLTTLGLVLLLAVFPSSTAIDRFLLYLFPLQFVILSRLPRALSVNQQSAVQLTPLVIGYAAVVQATFLILGAFASYYIPYKSIFDS